MHLKVFNRGYLFVYQDLIQGSFFLIKIKEFEQNFLFFSSGCLHAYISYLDDGCDVCLVLLTVNPEHFQILADFKQTISEVKKREV